MAFIGGSGVKGPTPVNMGPPVSFSAPNTVIMKYPFREGGRVDMYGDAIPKREGLLGFSDEIGGYVPVFIILILIALIMVLLILTFKMVKEV